LSIVFNKTLHRCQEATCARLGVAAQAPILLRVRPPCLPFHT
jgi:hypothetical protein